MTQAAVIVLAATLAGGQGERFTRVAEGLAAAINAQDAKVVEQLFAPAMQKFLPEDKAGEFIRGLVQERGKIVKVGEPVLEAGAARIRLKCERGDWEMQLSLDAKDLIAGLFFRPAPPEIPVPERNATPTRLPFREEWFVAWGGATKEQNQHVGVPNQRRAVDFLIHDAQGKSHTGAGTRNEDYYAYGKEVLAPGDGTVVTVIEGVPDCVPPSMNPFSAVGNCVILQHAKHEFSVIAHFKPHTIAVKVGERVKAGQVLGQCGNSGNSSEPHIHFHLQNSAVLQDGTGFAPYFENVRLIRDGKTTIEKDYTPIRNDRLSAE